MYTFKALHVYNINSNLSQRQFLIVCAQKQTLYKFVVNAIGVHILKLYKNKFVEAKKEKGIEKQGEDEIKWTSGDWMFLRN